MSVDITQQQIVYISNNGWSQLEPGDYNKTKKANKNKAQLIAMEH